jgi:zinc transporter, ZIP family
MIAFFEQFSPIIQALIGTLFTWFLTALGASLVFFTKDVSQSCWMAYWASPQV